MDYLDPRKQFRHHIILMVGYVLVAVAIVLTTIVFIYQAYGFGLKDGSIIQNGLAYMSSQPSSAQIYLNDSLYTSKTNARLFIPANIYQVRLHRDGYRDWQRTIAVDGGAVSHFDYPLLFPATLATTTVQSYNAAPTLMTHSPDQRWLVLQQPANSLNFDIFDLKNPTKVASPITVPSNVVTKATTSESWQAIEWADDNQHLLLQHLYDASSEFLLIDRTAGGQAVNLNQTLGLNPTKLSLDNRKFDAYYIYNGTTTSLQTASLKTPTPVNVVDHVLAYKTYGNNSVLYATTTDAPSGKVLIKLTTGTQSYIIRSFPTGSNYLLDLSSYSGTLYAAAGSSAENRVYIYRDPVGQLAAEPTHAVVPTQVLHVNTPDYLSFSTTAQYIVVEHGLQFGVYDFRSKTGYNYTITHPLDAMQTHATWFDAARLSYVSGGKLQVLDFDSTNPQSLMQASPSSLPAISPDGRYLYDMTVAPNGQAQLTQTALRIPTDL